MFYNGISSIDGSSKADGGATGADGIGYAAILLARASVFVLVCVASGADGVGSGSSGAGCTLVVLRVAACKVADIGTCGSSTGGKGIFGFGVCIVKVVFVGVDEIKKSNTYS